MRHWACRGFRAYGVASPAKVSDRRHTRAPCAGEKGVARQTKRRRALKNGCAGGIGLACGWKRGAGEVRGIHTPTPL